MKTKTRKPGSVVEMPKTDRSLRSVVKPIVEASRPGLEVIACMANCAGLPETGIRFTFDLRDNRAERVYTSLSASKIEGEWHISGVWPKELPESGDVPLLVALTGERNYVEGETGEFSERHMAVSEELDRWSRNLFSLADEESQLDDGLDDFKRRLADIKTDYGVKFDDDGKKEDEEAYARYWKWPLRP